MMFVRSSVRVRNAVEHATARSGIDLVVTGIGHNALRERLRTR